MRKYTTLFSLFTISLAFSQVPFYPAGQQSGATFGSQISLDNNDFVVSSGSSPIFGTGNVYVFHNTPAGIVQADALFPADALQSDAFGSSTAIDNDFIAAGAYRQAGIASGSGAVYMYQKIAGNFQQVQKITAPDATENAHFGAVVRLYGNYMFISATGDNLNAGAVYVYGFNGTDWTFSQKLTSANSHNLGAGLAVSNNRLVMTNDGPDGERYFITYTLNGTTLEFENIIGPFVGQFVVSYSVNDFSVSDDQLSFIVPNYSPQDQEVRMFSHVGNTWIEETPVPIEAPFPTLTQVFTTVELSGDNLFVGSTAYVLQTQRKFPLRYYRKTDGLWVFQTTLFGTATDQGNDDYFGAVAKCDGTILLIGAPTEGSVAEFGKAYYIDMQTLGTEGFAKSTVSVYPNPATDILYIKNDTANSIKKIDVLSISGQLLFSQSQNLETLSIENLAAGMYFVEVEFTQGIKQAFKIVKN